MTDTTEQLKNTVKQLEYEATKTGHSIDRLERENNLLLGRIRGLESALRIIIHNETS